MQKFCICETGYKLPQIACIKPRCKTFASGKLGKKKTKIDCIKLRYKNSASGKLDTNYFKSPASSQDAKLLHLGNWIKKTQNRLHQAKMQKFWIWETEYKTPKIDCILSYSLSQNCRGTELCLLVPPMLVYTIWWLNRNKQHWEGKGKHKKGKNSVFSVPTTAVFLSGTVGLSLEWLWEVEKN